uniref:Uncharacterized protein n=1 Tax=Picea sitchensis TaxID=3332 RepID=A9NM25_PICSI|nr:unknown [Picea sitchensis]
MAAVTKQRQPPVGYPTGGEVKEEQAPQVVDDNTDKAQQNVKDDGETDRGISPGFIIGRRYSGPVLYNYSGPGSHGQPAYPPNHPGQPAYPPNHPGYYRQPPRRGPSYYRDQYGQY